MKDYRAMTDCTISGDTITIKKSVLERWYNYNDKIAKVYGKSKSRHKDYYYGRRDMAGRILKLFEER